MSPCFLEILGAITWSHTPFGYFLLCEAKRGNAVLVLKVERVTTVLGLPTKFKVVTSPCVLPTRRPSQVFAKERKPFSKRLDVNPLFFQNMPHRLTPCFALARMTALEASILHASPAATNSPEPLDIRRGDMATYTNPSPHNPLLISSKMYLTRHRKIRRQVHSPVHASIIVLRDPARNSVAGQQLQPSHGAAEAVLRFYAGDDFAWR